MASSSPILHTRHGTGSASTGPPLAPAASLIAALDAAGQPSILASVADHRGRPFMFEGTDEVRFMGGGRSAGLVGWAHLSGSGSRLYDQRGTLRVTMGGGRAVLLEPKQLEHTRVQRHMYEVEWEEHEGWDSPEASQQDAAGAAVLPSGTSVLVWAPPVPDTKQVVERMDERWCMH